jgi:hypothetical protein
MTQTLLFGPEPSTSEPALPHVQLGARTLPAWLPAILAGVTVTGDQSGHWAKLNCGQLAPDDYKLVNDTLQRIGGKWKGSRKAHHFAFDPAGVIQAVAESGLMPEKNPLAFFPTPRSLLKNILSWDTVQGYLRFIEANPDLRILEPSAGTGAIVNALLEDFPGLRGRIDCVEPDPIKCHLLRQLNAGQVFNSYFENWEPDARYHAVLMNPPFSTPEEQDAYITHIRKAASLLADVPSKLLVAIAPSNCLSRDSARHREFRNFAGSCLEVEVLEPGVFKDSGTNIETAILYGFPGDLWRQCPYQDYPDWHTFQFFLWVDNSSPLLKQLEALTDAIDKPSDADLDVFIRAAISDLDQECPNGSRVITTPAVMVNLRQELRDRLALPRD